MTSDSARLRIRMTKDDRLELIFDQAMRLIGEQGYWAFTLNELAVRCNMTVAGILHHFGSKENLLVALLRERDRQDEVAVTELISPYFTGSTVSRELCKITFHAIVERAAVRPELIRLYALLRSEALAPDHPAYLFFRNRERNTIELYRKMLIGHVEDALSSARQVEATITGLEAMWVRQDFSFDMVAEWDYASRQILP